MDYFKPFIYVLKNNAAVRKSNFYFVPSGNFLIKRNLWKKRVLYVVICMTLCQFVLLVTAIFDNGFLYNLTAKVSK